MSRRVVSTILIAVGVAAGGTLIARRLGYNLGVNTVVRCRKGHMFSTIWIPGVKLKELDLVVARVQRCPVGKHWSLVVPVREKDLTEAEPAGLAAEVRFGAGEPAEDAVQVARRDAAAEVGHGDDRVVTL